MCSNTIVSQYTYIVNRLRIFIHFLGNAKIHRMKIREYICKIFKVFYRLLIYLVDKINYLGFVLIIYKDTKLLKYPQSNYLITFIDTIFLLFIIDRTSIKRKVMIINLYPFFFFFFCWLRSSLFVIDVTSFVPRNIKKFNNLNYYLNVTLLILLTSVTYL